MTSLFCFGLGYSAEALARRVRPLGWHIAGTARTPEGVAHIRALGYDGVLFDGQSPAPDVADALSTATHVLISAGPDEQGDATLRHHAEDIARASDLHWIGYLSTIGVYGNTDGQWIDETAPANPGSERSKRRYAAENDWLAFGRTHGKLVQIFRLGGIYGPGRSAIDDLRDGTARRIVKPGQVFNRIHVDDIAATLLAAADGRGSHDVYNVVDDEPTPSQDVICRAADMIGITPPPEISVAEANLSPMGRSFYAENRRIRNSRLHDDLGVTLAYPSYREGLAGILAK
ncbi:MAG TPA: SDR family oxidoreductase [Hyphomicrobium sp.]|nr:SDR family oxidoreductase [Hyphomicrobium sp.]